MTIEATSNRISYNGNAVTTAFAYPYSFHDQADIKVISTLISSGAATLMVLGTDYTISGTPDDLGHYVDGATINMTLPPASTKRLTIYSDPVQDQDVDLQDLSVFPAEVVEAALDRAMLIARRLGDLSNRSLRQPDGDADDMDALPTKVDRASTYLGFDSDGNPMAIAAEADALLVSAFAEDLLDSPGGTQFLATLRDDLTAYGSADVQAADEVMVRKTASGNWFQTTINKLGKVVAVEQLTTSGTSKTFSSIPSGVKRITMTFNAVSTNGTTGLLLKLGDAGGIEATGYKSTSTYQEAAAAVAGSSSTAGFYIHTALAANKVYGAIVLTLMNDATFTWACHGVLILDNAVASINVAGIKALSQELSQVSIGSVNGVDAFDGGSVNISYEY